MEMTIERIGQTNISPFAKPEFRLGMPHMAVRGVSQEWLLREACHRHWESIAGAFGAQPKEFRDKSGARVLPSVVACTLTGDAQQFKEGDLCQLFQIEKPCAENGWRSQVDLVSNEVTLRAEIITSFARRNGPANRNLARADMEDALQPVRKGERAQRTNTIRLLGKSDRAKAEKGSAPPHLTFTIDPDQHLNGVGLVYFAEIHKMITMAERNAVPDLVAAWPMRNRRINFFCNLDVGDCLELTTETSVQAFSPNASVVVRTFAKRSTDNAVVACAEAIYRLAN